jgi:hypothetical protein
MPTSRACYMTLPATLGTAPAAWLEKIDERCRSRSGSFDYLSKGEHAMQDLLMIYHDETLRVQMPDAQKGQIMQEYDAFIQSFVKSGHFRAGTRL